VRTEHIRQGGQESHSPESGLRAVGQCAPLGRVGAEAGARPRALCWGWGAGQGSQGPARAGQDMGTGTRESISSPPYLPMGITAEQGQHGRRGHGLTLPGRAGQPGGLGGVVHRWWWAGATAGHQGQAGYRGAGESGGLLTPGAREDKGLGSVTPMMVTTTGRSGRGRWGHGAGCKHSRQGCTVG
jgi:hypothetical protein